ncbi:MAG: adenylate/guanylate cyclase domain-containing protein [Gammaproteobacteria bacterium]
MLTSKQIMEQTGISRATLNNYISMGLLQKPLVQRTREDDGRAPRIGYFPDDALERINEIQSMKKQGMSMTSICEQFGQPPPAMIDEPGLVTTDPVSGNRSLTFQVDIDHIPGPAYMVNNNFELVWWNEYAEQKLFGTAGAISNEIADRSLFKLLIESKTFRAILKWQEILAVHMEMAKRRITPGNLATLQSSLEPDNSSLLYQLYNQVEPMVETPVLHLPIQLGEQGSEQKPYTLYACSFREGIFFTCVESEMDNSPLLELLSRRDYVIRNLLKKRRPFLTQLSVMVADLQNSMQICAELPPNEYFQLINDIWQAAEPVFRKYYGTHGKHVGDGMLYYFFPQPDSNYIMNAILCAHDLKAMMSEISREWQQKKNWLHELHLNIGLDEGQEWFGTYSSGSNLEFTVLGDTVNHASRISDFARNGAIWSTKHMVENLSNAERERLRFGIRRKAMETGEEILVRDIYSRVSGIVDLEEGRNYKFNDIATITVTEIINIKPQSTG